MKFEGAHSGADSNPLLSRRDILKIARRFNAGLLTARIRVPKGRLNIDSLQPAFSRPYGTCSHGAWLPALKRRAIFNRPAGTSLPRLCETALPSFSPKPHDH